MMILIAVVIDLLYFQLPQNAIGEPKNWLAPPMTARLLSGDTTRFRIYSPGADDAHKAAFARAHGWSGNLQPFLDQREFLQVNTNTLYGLSSADGYIPLAPEYVVDVWGDMNRPGVIKKTASVTGNVFVARPSFGKLLGMWNVRYALLAWPFKGEGFTGARQIGPVHLLTNARVLPRAYVVHDALVARDESDALARLLSDDLDPAEKAVVFEKPPDLPGGTGHRSSATIQEYRNNVVTVHVSADAPGLLILSDSYYPGWGASVDGAVAPILRANVSQRAVAVPAGDHLVTFTFAPSSFTAGLALTAISFAVFGAAMIFRRGRNA
jgi:hypothetical protein